MRKSVKVEMQTELAARPIANLVQTASHYNSRVYLEVEGKRVNAKSIMGMMSLALLNGAEVTIEAEGEDEEAAIAAMEEFLTK